MADSLSKGERSRLAEDGYVILRNVIAPDAVTTARRLIYQDLGRQRAVAMAAGRNPEAIALEKLRTRTEASMKLGSDPAVTDLFNASPLLPILSSALGAELAPQRGAQLATLFPSDPSGRVNEAGYPDDITPFYGWHGHLDGLWNGATAPHQDLSRAMNAEEQRAFMAEPSTNMQLKTHPEHGANLAGFTALVGVALSDQTRPGSGNLGLLKGGHLAMTRFFREQQAAGGPIGPDGPGWPRIHEEAPNGCGLRHYPDAVREAFAGGAATTPDGRTWPQPTLVDMAPGDAVIVLFATPHGATRVEGPEPRLSAYFRITSPLRPDPAARVHVPALLDPFSEWPNLPEAAGLLPG